MTNKTEDFCQNSLFVERARIGEWGREIGRRDFRMMMMCDGGYGFGCTSTHHIFSHIDPGINHRLAHISTRLRAFAEKTGINIHGIRMAKHGYASVSPFTCKAQPSTPRNIPFSDIPSFAFRRNVGWMRWILFRRRRRSLFFNNINRIGFSLFPRRQLPYDFCPPFRGSTNVIYFYYSFCRWHYANKGAIWLPWLRRGDNKINETTE